MLAPDGQLMNYGYNSDINDELIMQEGSVGGK